MTGLIVCLSIFAFFAIVFSFSLTIYVTINTKILIYVGCFGYKMKIDLFEDGELKEKKPKKQKKLKKVKKVEEAAEKIADKEPSKKSFSETIDFVLTLVKSILPNSVAMLKHLRLKVKRLNMTVTNEEADKTAIEYGEICAGIYTLLGTLSGLIKVKVKEVNICPDFINKKAVYDIYFTVKLRLLHILFALLGILGNFIKNIIKNKGK